MEFHSCGEMWDEKREGDRIEKVKETVKRVSAGRVVTYCTKDYKKSGRNRGGMVGDRLWWCFVGQ